MTSDSTPLTTESTRHSSRWMALAVLLALVAAALVWWSLVDRQATQRELAAKAELSRLGALIVMDADRTHVNSVNLSTLKSTDDFDEAIALLPALGQLRSLNVTGMPFEDRHADTVAQLTALQDLVLTKTPITDRALQALENLSQLKTIYLGDTAVTRAGLPSLGRMRSLKIIDLSRTKVTGGLAPLTELSDLNWLVARGLSLDAAALRAIGQCESLTRLTLNETAVPEDSLQELTRTRPDLKIDR